MAWKHVQSPLPVTFGNSVSAETIAFASAVAAGDCLVLIVCTFNNVTVTVSDSVNGAWTQIGSYAGSTSKVSIWYFLNSAAGTPTVTVTPSATAYMSLACAEYSGISAVDASDTGTTGANGTLTTNSITVSQAGDLVVAGFASGSVNGTPTSSQSNSNIRGVVPSSSNIGLMFADKSADANTTVVVNSAFNNYSAIGASFKATGGGGGGGGLLAHPGMSGRMAG